MAAKRPIEIAMGAKSPKKTEFKIIERKKKVPKNSANNDLKSID